MARVDVCPQNWTKVIEASEKLGCGDDDYGNNQYLCLPHVNKTSLVEFCYEGIMGRQEKASEGKLIHTNCVGFSSGCPETPYITSDFYKYSACQELNLDHHCYKFDPHCPPKNDVETNDTPTTISILVVCLGLAIVFIALFCILLFCRQKLRQLCYGNNRRNETQHILSPDRTDDENMPLDPQETGKKGQKKTEQRFSQDETGLGDVLSQDENMLPLDPKKTGMKGQNESEHLLSQDGTGLSDVLSQDKNMLPLDPQKTGMKGQNESKQLLSQDGTGLSDVLSQDENMLPLDPQKTGMKGQNESEQLLSQDGTGLGDVLSQDENMLPLDPKKTGMKGQNESEHLLSQDGTGLGDVLSQDENMLPLDPKKTGMKGQNESKQLLSQDGTGLSDVLSQDENMLPLDPQKTGMKGQNESEQLLSQDGTGLGDVLSQDENMLPLDPKKTGMKGQNESEHLLSQDGTGLGDVLSQDENMLPLDPKKTGMKGQNESEHLLSQDGTGLGDVLSQDENMLPLDPKKTGMKGQNESEHLLSQDGTGLGDVLSQDENMLPLDPKKTGMKGQNESEHLLSQDGTGLSDVLSQDKNMLPLDPQKTGMKGQNESEQLLSQDGTAGLSDVLSQEKSMLPLDPKKTGMKGQNESEQLLSQDGTAGLSDVLSQEKSMLPLDPKKTGMKGQNESEHLLSQDGTAGLSDVLSQDETMLPLDPKKTAIITHDGDNQEKNAVSSEKAISNRGDNSKEKGTAVCIKQEESKKETVGSDDKSSDGDTLTERQGQALNLAKNAVKEMRECNNTGATTDHVFYNVILLMKIAKMFTDNPDMSILDLIPACSFLTKVFRKNECSLGHIKTLPGQQEECFKLLGKTDKTICNKVLRHEEYLLGTNLYLADLKDPSEDYTDRLKNILSDEEIASFLSTLQSEVKKLISKPKEKTACQATAYVNLYCKIQILHSFVLWQVFCIMNGSAYCHSSEKVLAMINSSQKTNLEMLKCITEPETKNAVFLSVFNITENEHIKHFFQIQNIETHLDKRFYERKYELQWIRSPDVKLVMKRLTFKSAFGVYALTGQSNHFKFESVEGREFDNVCYIMVELEERPLYIGISSDGECKTHVHQIKKADGVRWKLMSFGMDTFILASVDWSDMFLYFDLTNRRLKGTRDTEKVINRGIWKIVSV
uniref:Uncharacterized protein LOC111105304 isoform X5 n=1 Tax=Crassostrea virginica TaxID=6565 RepID=A0A8B8AY40_CRAVI|nr:uncharacterized protein LOC111105304 isoform X5 [Crassostrea virginica]